MAPYDQLLAHAPSPIVALHRGVTVAEVDGPDAALALVDPPDLDAYSTPFAPTCCDAWATTSRQ